ncbi:diphosphomevalonate/mevalonate 3,5-bisphosphate decarboxylase family protein [Maribacter cobaltidurans]|uniref:Diphosphomevalonate decarboxylase n=1 Tax=Maribacter cobaltidurans TaxID=1178778 RepID=A0A223V5A1_9FLAO|nr:diphosphomevalonate decarboxylase [Maribacter cobaltidurans]ASV30595.1 diphosphomevalonate decarboxylase [Maribacter cobaltidurans]GGD80112.1 diphosphomevalonate decarboxylase [Maribacter cobaltidurans]
MTEKDFVLSGHLELKDEGKVGYKAPSNIALVKYWGKKEGQIPANPSISFTLSACATTTSITFKKLSKPTGQYSFDLLFEGKPKPSFHPKIETFFKRIDPFLPFLKHYHFNIETSNSFPHSSGIASSASGMAAMALCLMEIERMHLPAMEEDLFLSKASFLARLGSGSACRSVEGPLVAWGNHEDILESTNLYGIKYPFDMHPIFNNYHDTILLVDKGQKQVSSTVGHDLVNGHPFSEQRFQQAHSNLTRLKTILKEGNVKEFIKVVESEALTLHAIMMTGDPYFILMKPNTLEIINKIWKFREKSGSHVCFTLDAGANVHVLYPQNEKEKVNQFIVNELVAYCENRQYICDQIGGGAVKMKV